MKKWVSFLFFSVFLFNVTNVLAIQNLTPVGYWDQLDDKTGELQSIVQLWKSGAELKGRIIKGFPMNGKEPNHFCTKCPGEFKGKRIVDLTFIWGLSYNEKNNSWEGGHILDPESGRIYRVRLALKEGGKKLHVRGYIGISLLGRSQTWIRITPTQMKAQLEKIELLEK